jgi:hypothetical protein
MVGDTMGDTTRNDLARLDASRVLLKGPPQLCLAPVTLRVYLSVWVDMLFDVR